jgi:hypothetical protein
MRASIRTPRAFSIKLKSCDRTRTDTARIAPNSILGTTSSSVGTFLLNTERLFDVPFRPSFCATLESTTLGTAPVSMTKLSFCSFPIEPCTTIMYPWYSLTRISTRLSVVCSSPTALAPAPAKVTPQIKQRIQTGRFRLCRRNGSRPHPPRTCDCCPVPPTLSLPSAMCLLFSALMPSSSTQCVLRATVS